jgi:hypothetical protein
MHLMFLNDELERMLKASTVAYFKVLCPSTDWNDWEKAYAVELFAHRLISSTHNTHPIQWVQEDLSLGVKRPGREADHSPPSTAEVKEWVELYLHSLNMPSWCGA